MCCEDYFLKWSHWGECHFLKQFLFGSKQKNISHLVHMYCVLLRFFRGVVAGGLWQRAWQRTWQGTQNSKYCTNCEYDAGYNVSLSTLDVPDTVVVTSFPFTPSREPGSYVVNNPGTAHTPLEFFLLFFSYTLVNSMNSNKYAEKKKESKLLMYSKQPMLTPCLL